MQHISFLFGNWEWQASMEFQEAETKHGRKWEASEYAISGLDWKPAGDESGFTGLTECRKALLQPKLVWLTHFSFCHLSHSISLEERQAAPR